MWRLDNAIQRYAWGSHVALATLQGRPVPTAEPEAELWMGAHPRAPSALVGDGRSLLAAIESEPEAMLGASVLRRFGSRLPFLLKVLAAEQPLSLQAHPDAERARSGCAEEDAAGIPREAPHRNYPDPHAKPELVCALGPFVALCGFADVERTKGLIDTLGVPSLRAIADGLWTKAPSEALAEIVRRLLTMPEPGPLVDAVARAAARPGAGGDRWQREREWVRRLAERHPTDAGVVVALLLELVELRRGEALYLSAGNLHCYLEGTAVEIMGGSDDVLRGGLTPKHVDVPELLRVLDLSAGTTRRVLPRAVSDHEAVYDTPALEFALSRIELPAGSSWSASSQGPEVLLCVEGRVRLEGTPDPVLLLSQGDSAFVPASQPEYRARPITDATLFRATVGTPTP
ncbi:mannose-6-phosphate isomerase, class I [Paraliomyxa miuraensis]|uniref:mannose-6-phosphate isomerase, class I n=1 Tax=Paraliomyxa miuraensis TaxID=376150 RepID=UPI002253F64C|nr:mannose-6-phosphate isomerase, class I [Paraliomyxa miuraensis]MCX4245129.1 mannose-6-phosphate isomerase, class I [Paraliomyxa miuraensis]